MEYAYLVAPQAMQGIIMGLFWMGTGVAHFLAMGLPSLFHTIPGLWSSTVYINSDRLDFVFFILAVFLLSYTFIFALIAKFCDLDLTLKTTAQERSGQVKSYSQLKKYVVSRDSNSTRRESMQESVMHM